MMMVMAMDDWMVIVYVHSDGNCDGDGDDNDDNEDGVWSEKCKFCSPIKPNPTNAKTAYNSWTTQQLIAEAKKRGLL
jgi:hypothetical protein